MNEILRTVLGLAHMSFLGPTLMSLTQRPTPNKLFSLAS